MNKLIETEIVFDEDIEQEVIDMFKSELLKNKKVLYILEEK